ncbi:MAG: type II toxin-antitoxin system VapC family toxin [Dehalococcoidia bacterium]
MVRFLDANIPMYAAGGDHRLREPSRQVIYDAGRNSREYVTSVEVCQEIIHRYLAIGRWEALGRRALQDFLTLMSGRIESVYQADVVTAARLADRYAPARPQSRDLFHVAVMQRLGVREIVSTDTGFDSIPDVTRIDPLTFA